MPEKKSKTAVSLRGEEPSSEEILAGFLNKESGATEVILGWIREIITFRKWNNRIPTDDVVQDAFLRVDENLREGKLRKTGSLKPYVQNIARRTVIDTWRVERRYKAVEDITDRLAGEYGTDAPLINQDHVFLFFQLLGKAGKECRRLWRLIVVEKLSQQEVAARLNITLQAVKTRNHRCRKSVAEERRAFL